MARTAVNPIVLSIPSPTGLELTTQLAADAQTWKKGEFCILSSGTLTPLVGTGSTAIYGIFAEDQTTVTSTSTVPFYLLKAGTRLLMYVMTNGTAAASSVPTLGTKYGAEALSNISYLDTGTASGQFLVIRKYSTNNPEMDGYSDADAAPGLVEAEFTYVS